MRCWHPVIAIGVLLMMAACSGRPNDLRHYQVPATTASSTAPASDSTANAKAVVSVPAAKKISLPEALLADSAATSQGFHAAQTAQPTVFDQLGTCQVPLNQPVAAQSGYQAKWIGATPATTLREYAASYPGDQAAAVVAHAQQALGCATELRDGVAYQVSQIPSTPLVGVDNQFAWCTSSSRQASCEIVFSKGELLADLEIVTTTEAKAKNLLAAAAPWAADALVAAIQ